MKIINLKNNPGEHIPKNFTGIIDYENGTKYWYKEGEYHREDGPAIEFSSGGKQWYFEGKLHRIDGPAVVSTTEFRNHRWYIEGIEYEKNVDIVEKVFLGKEKGKYDLEWLRFMTETGIEEFPIIPGLEYEFKINLRILESLTK